MSENPIITRRKFIYGAGLTAIPLLAQPFRPFARSVKSLAEHSHKILCCNIRVALQEDVEKGVGWDARREICIDIIRSQRPDIIGFQEVIRPQMKDLKKAFPGFGSFGFEGPEMDAHPTGYHGIAKNPILFSAERYEMLSAGEFWLSETPLIAGSISWDSARARHANWVRLKEKRTGKDFRFINLHLDHKNQEARENQVRLVMKEAGQYAPEYSQILTGDFNASAANPVYGIVKESGWTDTHTCVHGEEEPGYTVHQFQGERYKKKAKGKKIDFIFCRGGIKARQAEIIRDSKNGRYPSDHYFVSAVIDISGKKLP